MSKECLEWLSEARDVFLNLNKMIILADYKRMSQNRLGYVKAKIEQKIDFDPEALLLGNSTKVQKRRLRPKEFQIFINRDLQKIKNQALRKQIVQHILMHELLHIEL